MSTATAFALETRSTWEDLAAVDENDRMEPQRAGSASPS